MNLGKLFAWVVGVVMMFAVTGKLDVLQNWIWRAQAKVIYESRGSNWGSLRFFQKPSAERFNPSKSNVTISG
jgi:hypothetical protein